MEESLAFPRTDNFLPCTFNDSNHNDYHSNNNSLNHALIILVLNFQSLLAKKESFLNLISLNHPDIIVGCESWLRPEVKNGEIFPSIIIMFIGQIVLIDMEVYLYHAMTLLLQVTCRLKHPVNCQHV